MTLPVNFDSVGVDAILADWVRALRDSGVEAVLVMGPNPMGGRDEREVLAVHPPRLLGAAEALAASTDFGASWREVASPIYPEQPAEPPQPFPWKLGLIWSLERSVDGSLWCGTLPGGLFVSRDRAQSWQLVDSLWNMPARLEWFGGGYPEPGIHSICPHPTDANELLIGLSCAGE